MKNSRTRRQSTAMNDKPADAVVSYGVKEILGQINVKLDSLITEVNRKADRSDVTLLAGVVEQNEDEFRKQLSSTAQAERVSALEQEVRTLKSQITTTSAVMENATAIETVQRAATEREAEQKRLALRQWVGIGIAALFSLAGLILTIVFHFWK